MGTQRTKAQLIAQTTAVITSGVTNGITGAILNTLLDDYSESLIFNQDEVTLDSNNFTFNTVKPVVNNAGQGNTGEKNTIDIIVDTGIDDMVTMIKATSITNGISNIIRIQGDKCSEQFFHFDTFGDDAAMGFTDDGFFVISDDTTITTNRVLEIDINEDHSLTIDAGFNYVVNSASNRKISIYNQGTGDSVVECRVSAQIYVFGIDNSDSDKWKLSVGGVLGTNDVIVVDTSNNFILPSLPTASVGLPSGALWSDSGTIKII